MNLKTPAYFLSVVVPLHNEGQGLQSFHADLVPVLTAVAKDNYEIIYCDDGSTDHTAEVARRLHAHNPRVKLVALSRNFGKESALTAGIAQASGQAIVMLDGDGQHPVELIPKFVEAWKDGAQVVVGVRTGNTREGLVKRWGSKVFYRGFNKMTGQAMVPGSSDFRLIDRSVQQAFLQLPETDRLTRGLIDWLGFKRQFIYFTAHARGHGQAAYTKRKLMGLAVNSFVSLSPTPLYMFGFLGVFITTGALVLGLAVFIEQLLLGDPWSWNFTGTAMLGILILFLVGIVLMSQGILSLYISHVHSQSKRRPLYVIDPSNSVGLQEKT